MSESMDGKPENEENMELDQSENLSEEPQGVSDYDSQLELIDENPTATENEAQEPGEHKMDSTQESLSESKPKIDSDSDSEKLVIAEPGAGKRSPRKRTRTSSGAVEPARTLPSRNKGRGMAYLLAMEKGLSKKKLAAAQAQVLDNSLQTSEHESSLVNSKQEIDQEHQTSEGVRDSIQQSIDSVIASVAKSPGLPPVDPPAKVRTASAKKSYGGANIASPIFREPFKYGWKREVVFRATVDNSTRTMCDVYYYSPTGKKLRSGREVMEYLDKTNSPLSVENFTYFKEPLGNEPSEILRYAKRRDEGERSFSKKEKTSKVREVESPRDSANVSSDFTVISSENAAEGEEGTPGANFASQMKKRKSKVDKPESQLRVKLWGKKFKGVQTKENTEPVAFPQTKDETIPCSLDCPKAEGVLPSQTCQDCFALFHTACVKDGTSFKCSRCVARENEGLAAPTDDSLSAKFSSPAEVQQLFVPLSASGARLGKQAAGKLNAFQQNIELICGKRFVSVSSYETENAEQAPQQPAKRQTVSPERKSPTRVSPKRVRTQQKAPEIGAAAPILAPPVTAAPVPGEEAPKLESAPSGYLSFLSSAYEGILSVFRYLTVQELMTASRVCRLWRDIAFHHSHWRTVRLRNLHIYDWPSFTAHLRRTGTQHLDMRKMLFVSSAEETWENFQKSCRNLSELTSVTLCKCPASVLESVASNCPRLRIVDAQYISSNGVSLATIGKLLQLQVLKLRGVTSLTIEDSLENLEQLKQLKFLSLTSLGGVAAGDLKFLARLKNLESLDFGDCTNLEAVGDYRFFTSLTALRRLRLEQGPTAVEDLDILELIAEISNLAELEVVHFGTSGNSQKFFEKLAGLKQLLLVPRYSEETLKSTVENLISALPLTKGLQHLTWVFSDEAVKWLEAGSLGLDLGVPEKGSFSLEHLENILKTKLPSTEVKLMSVPGYAVHRYSLTRLSED